jgi:hypothetical protein
MSKAVLLRFIAVAVLVATAIACAPKPSQKVFTKSPVSAGPGTITQARQYLEGRWTLVSMDLFPPNQAPIHVVGSGTLVYDDFANMTVDLTLDPATAALFERIGISAPGGVISTTGRTVIDMQSRALSYVLEGQAAVRPPTHPLDTNRPRYWEVEGNTLTLRTKDADGTVLSVAVWRKAALTSSRALDTSRTSRSPRD